MKIQNTHFLNVKWNFLLGIFIGFALLFSTFSFANTNTMQMPVNHSATDHGVIANQVDGHHAEAIPKSMKDSQDCCMDDKKSPCRQDGGCKISCMSFGHSYVILIAAGNLSSLQTVAVITANATLKDGISPVLNVPPPRA